MNLNVWSLCFCILLKINVTYWYPEQSDSLSENQQLISHSAYTLKWENVSLITLSKDGLGGNKTKHMKLIIVGRNWMYVWFSTLIIALRKSSIVHSIEIASFKMYFS